jgi:hypothetical protein
MLTLPRRFLVLIALMFWQGGFLFYASVVVPIGQQVLGSHRAQGNITQQVTDYMNLSGGIALLPLAWDCAVGQDPSSRRRYLRWLCWLGMAVGLAALVWLHPQLDAALKSNTRDEYAWFRSAHRWYLWISSIQWGFGIGYVALMLRGWSAEDGTFAKPQAAGEKKCPVVGSSGVAQSPESSADGTH